MQLLKQVQEVEIKLDKDYKNSMPKDAYAMWNKLQKSIIVPSNGTEHTNCSDCGECTAVCPTGALTERDFLYKANPWELREVPSACAHCSSACHLYYETRFESINNPEERIFRIKNEFHYQSLCGAGRFGYDYENREGSKTLLNLKRWLRFLEGRLRRLD